MSLRLISVLILIWSAYQLHIKIALVEQEVQRGLISSTHSVTTNKSGALQVSEWLPDPLTQRTPLVLGINMPIHIKYNKLRQVQIVEGPALPEQDSKRTNSKVITEEIPYYYKWHNKTKTLFRGPKPDFISPGKILTQREQEHHDFVETYENPIEKAMEYARMMQEEKLSQNSLAKKLGISRVRVTQILNLLKLSQEQQEDILKNGKEHLITERQLRKKHNFIYASHP